MDGKIASLTVDINIEDGVPVIEIRDSDTGKFECFDWKATRKEYEENGLSDIHWFFDCLISRRWDDDDDNEEEEEEELD